MKKGLVYFIPLWYLVDWWNKEVGIGVGINSLEYTVIAGKRSVGKKMGSNDSIKIWIF